MRWRSAPSPSPASPTPSTRLPGAPTCSRSMRRSSSARRRCRAVVSRWWQLAVKHLANQASGATGEIRSLAGSGTGWSRHRLRCAPGNRSTVGELAEAAQIRAAVDRQRVTASLIEARPRAIASGAGLMTETDRRGRSGRLAIRRNCPSCLGRCTSLSGTARALQHATMTGSSHSSGLPDSGLSSRLSAGRCLMERAAHSNPKMPVTLYRILYSGEGGKSDLFAPRYRDNMLI